jgi:hypothetical protein
VVAWLAGVRSWADPQGTQTNSESPGRSFNEKHDNGGQYSVLPGHARQGAELDELLLRLWSHPSGDGQVTVNDVLLLLPQPRLDELGIWVHGGFCLVAPSVRERDPYEQSPSG